MYSAEEKQEHLFKLEKIKDQGDELMLELINLQNNAPYNSADFSNLTCDFLDENEIDIFALSVKAVNNGKNIFQIAHLLGKLIPNIKDLNIDSLLNFLILFFEKSKKDLASGILHEPIKLLCSKNELFAQDFEKKLLERKDSRLYGYIIAVNVGLSKINFDLGFSKIIELTKSEDYALISAGLRALGHLSISGDNFEKAKKILLKFINAKEPEILTSVTFSLCRHSEADNELYLSLTELSQNGIPEAKYEIVSFIDSKCGELTDKDVSILGNLCNYDLKWKGISDRLDYILYNLLLNKKYENVKKILNVWILEHSFKDHKESKFDEIFNSTLFELVKNEDYFGLMVSEWLNNDDMRFHHVLTEIFSSLRVHGLKSVKLNSNFLKDLNYIDYLYILRKIIGFVIDFDISISLVISMLKIDPLDEKVQDLIKDVLLNYFGYNHLSKTLDKLRNLLESENSNLQERNISKFCIKILEGRTKEMEKLPILNELFPNNDHQIKINKAFQKRISKAMKEAKERSPILGLVRNVPIKEGTSWFSYLNGQYNEPSQMKHYSHSLEIPKKDSIDEVGAAIERTGFRHIKRGEN